MKTKFLMLLILILELCTSLVSHSQFFSRPTKIGYRFNDDNAKLIGEGFNETIDGRGFEKKISLVFTKEDSIMMDKILAKTKNINQQLVNELAAAFDAISTEMSIKEVPQDKFNTNWIFSIGNLVSGTLAAFNKLPGLGVAVSFIQSLVDIDKQNKELKVLIDKTKKENVLNRFLADAAEKRTSIFPTNETIIKKNIVKEFESKGSKGLTDLDNSLENYNDLLTKSGSGGAYMTQLFKFNLIQELAISLSQAFGSPILRFELAVDGCGEHNQIGIDNWESMIYNPSESIRNVYPNCPHIANFRPNFIEPFTAGFAASLSAIQRKTLEFAATGDFGLAGDNLSLYKLEVPIIFKINFNGYSIYADYVRKNGELVSKNKIRTDHVGGNPYDRIATQTDALLKEFIANGKLQDMITPIVNTIAKQKGIGIGVLIEDLDIVKTYDPISKVLVSDIQYDIPGRYKAVDFSYISAIEAAKFWIDPKFVEVGKVKSDLRKLLDDKKKFQDEVWLLSAYTDLSNFTSLVNLLKNGPIVCILAEDDINSMNGFVIQKLKTTPNKKTNLGIWIPPNFTSLAKIGDQFKANQEVIIDLDKFIDLYKKLTNTPNTKLFVITPSSQSVE